jgi:hypothetical protein
MTTSKWFDIIEQMKGCGIEFVDGLSDAEITRVESRFSFRFPSDLREFLQTAVPQGEQFPDWRSQDEASLRDRLDIPRQGILFDVEHNNFWLAEWGPRAESLEKASRIVDELMGAAPKLIPIYSHRMMPDEPNLPGNPVFSVHQTDIIYYGFDLEDYLRHEFDLAGREPWPENVRAIRFWDIERFDEACWAQRPRVFDNRRGLLP